MSQIKVTEIDKMGSDLSIVNSARVSFRKKSEWEYRCCHCGKQQCPDHDFMHVPSLSDRDRRLVGYLARHNHTSPFNHVFASFHVKAPIFVARQLVKHEYLVWNEVSGRYVTFEPDFFIPESFRSKSDDKKQGSGPPLNEEYNEFAKATLKESCDLAYDGYCKLLGVGACEEQARIVLPLNLMTEWYWSGSLGAFAKMYNLRIQADAQAESQMVAQQIGEVMAKNFPVAWKALTE